MDTITRTPLATVSAVYDAFGRGDVPAVLALLADDVVVDAHPGDVVTSAQEAEHPLFVTRRGRDGAADFFGEVGRLQIHEFTVREILGGPDSQTVVAVIGIDLAYPSGARLRDDEVHVWTVGPDGLATSFRHVVDTAKHLAAWTGGDQPVRG